MKQLWRLTAVLLITGLFACKSKHTEGVPVVGFVDAFQDETIAQARTGFTDALKKNGFSEDQHSVEIRYSNAQGSALTLNQIISQYISAKVDVMATCPSASTVAAAQRTKTIPICMMVSPTLDRSHLLTFDGKIPPNLFGVVEGLPYIDTSFRLIQKLLKPKGSKLVVGMIYNQSEPQSADAMQRIKSLADQMNVQLVALPLNSSAEAQLVTKSLLEKNIDAFFANPDNTVFASFETILKSCNEKNVPIFTSEAGLVKRGAVAAFGADMYQWGYQAGLQAAQYFKTKSLKGLKPEMVKVRNRVYNPEAATKYHLTFPAEFKPVK